MRRIILLIAAVTAGCAHVTPSPAPVEAPPMCRIGPDGGAPLADRGIGGTGAPATVQTAERGIGGTGIVGVITGFGSVCLGGQEVAIDDSMPLRIDDVASPFAALRVGQIAVVKAAGPVGALTAQAIAVDHVVSGPVERIDDAGLLLVAGQHVSIAAATWNDTTPQLGDWVAVSGLRRPDGTIDATRIDVVNPGHAVVHGVVVRDGDRWRIGDLEIRSAVAPEGVSGQAVTAAGVFRDGVLVADRLTPDLLADNPGAYFGAAFDTLLLEGYVSTENGRVQLGAFGAAPGDGVGPIAAGRALVTLRRQSNGSFEAMFVRPIGVSLDRRNPASGRLEAAPVPDRTVTFGPTHGTSRSTARPARGPGGHGPESDPGQGPLGPGAPGFPPEGANQNNLLSPTPNSLGAMRGH